MQGYNATVFAYGPTGSGKTHTMLGTSDAAGLCVLTITDMFDQIRKDVENDYDVKITYVEIYNEIEAQSSRIPSVLFYYNESLPHHIVNSM